MDNYLIELKEKTKLMEAEKVVHLVSRLKLTKREGSNLNFPSNPSTNLRDRLITSAINYAVWPTNSAQWRKNKKISRSISTPEQSSSKK